MLTFANINLAPGQVLRIDTEQRTATVGGVSVLGKIAGGSMWFELEPGENDVTVSGGASIRVQWRERYL